MKVEGGYIQSVCLLWLMDMSFWTRTKTKVEGWNSQNIYIALYLKVLVFQKNVLWLYIYWSCKLFKKVLSKFCLPIIEYGFLKKADLTSLKTQKIEKSHFLKNYSTDQFFCKTDPPRTTKNYFTDRDKLFQTFPREWWPFFIKYRLSRNCFQNLCSRNYFKEAIFFLPGNFIFWYKNHQTL